MQGSTKALHSLYKAGANKDLKDNDGLTALMYAAMQGSTKALRSLCKAGANKDLKDNKGRTALMYAAMQGSTKDKDSKPLITTLLEPAPGANVGADKEIK